MAVRGELLYEGKAKKVYVTEDPDLLWVEFKDQATAFDGSKKATIPRKGELNCQISALIFQRLASQGLPNHFVSLISHHEMLVRRLDMLAVEVVVRNVAAGSLSQRLGLEEGTALPRPVVEFYYKNDDLHDPLINEDHIQALSLSSPEDVETMRASGLVVNRLLGKVSAEAGLVLVDFKLEFGRYRGRLLLGDEISPDTCRFWDAGSGEKMDKDRFRRDLGGLVEAYEEVLRRLKNLNGGN